MIAALGILGYVLLVIAPVAQICKSLKERDTHEVALFWPIISIAGMILLIPQIVVTADLILIVGHSAALLTNSVNLAILAIFRNSAAAER